MARRRESAPTPSTGSVAREFTGAELERIRELTAVPMSAWKLRGHPHPVDVELESIHAAAGRQRALKFWPLDIYSHNAEEAFKEEVSECWDEYRRKGRRHD